MDTLPSNHRHMVADYFLVVGLNDEATVLEDQSAPAYLNLPQLAKPITDLVVVVVGHGEKPPAGYRVVERSGTRIPGDLNHGSLGGKTVWLCYKTGKSEPPLTDIDVVYLGSKLAHGHEQLKFSVAGRDADVNAGAGFRGKKTYLSFRRDPIHGGALFRGMALTDLRVIYANKGDSCPRGFTKLNKNLNTGMVGSDVFLCYKKSMVKPASLNYQASVLSRYPTTEHEGFSLPESVPLFCLPLGVSIECWGNTAACPLPTFSTFVLTGATGDKVYGATVTFYEQLSLEKLSPSMKKVLLNTELERPVHVNKALCLLSHWPFFHAYKAFLASLYRISVSGPSPIPLERYISNFMLDVPFPSPSRPRVLLPIGNENVLLCEPERTQLPLSVANHTVILRCLDPDNILELICLLLLEYKVVLHSTRPALLTSFGESICSVLFPFKWQCPYIPLCPLALSSFVHAPMAFLIGIDSGYFDLYDTPEDVCCINLDSNSVSHTKESRESIKRLPKKHAKVLKQTLEELAVKVKDYPDNESGLAVDVAPLETMAGELPRSCPVSSIEVREAFLRFNGALLKDYKSFLKPIICAPSDKSTDLGNLFDCAGFKKTKPSAEQLFYSHLFSTQMFARFIEERSFASHGDSCLAFFDECTEKLWQKEPLVGIENDPAMSDQMTIVVTPPDSSGLPEGTTYSHPVFPELNNELFPASKSNAYLRVRMSRNDFGFRPGSPTHQRTYAEKRRAKTMSMRLANDPRNWARHLLGHVYTVWFMHLPAYANSTPFKRDVLLRAFKALQANQAKTPDEVCYRILMDLCGKLGHPALAVRVLMEMRHRGVQPDAVTYGHYNKAILESNWPTSRNWNRLRILISAIAHFRSPLKRRSTASPFTTLAHHPNFTLSNDFSGSSMLVLAGSPGGSTTPSECDGLPLRSSSAIFREKDYVDGPKIGIIGGKMAFSNPDLNLENDHETNMNAVYSPRRPVSVSVGQSPGVCTWNAPRSDSASADVAGHLNVLSASPDDSGVGEAEADCSEESQPLPSNNGSSNSQEHASPLPNSQPPDIPPPLPKSLCPTEVLPEMSPSEIPPPCLSLPDSQAADASDDESQDFKPLSHRTLSTSDSGSSQLLPNFESGKEAVPEPDAEDSSAWSTPTHTSLQRDSVVTDEIDFGWARKRGHRRDWSDVSIRSGAASAFAGLLADMTGEVVIEVNMASCNRCGSCQVLLFDEQIMSRWSPDDSNFTTRCCFCSEKLVATLQIRPVFLVSDCSSSTLTNMSVPYLNPLNLRKEVETLLDHDGEEELESVSLVTNHSVLYWNLVWYFSRVNLPSSLPDLILQLPDLKEKLSSSARVRARALWHIEDDGVNTPLYQFWKPKPKGKDDSFLEKKRRDSQQHSQVQSLAAHLQCGDFLSPLQKILETRLHTRGSEKTDARTHRSIYWEFLLFLASLPRDKLNAEKIDRDYRTAVSKLPREFAHLLRFDDHPPDYAAQCCRRTFGPLTV